MTAHCFSIPVWQPEPALSAFNAFCRAHRVLATERQLVQAGAMSVWALWVVVADGPGALPTVLKQPPSGPGAAADGAAKVDYRQVLSEPDFALFAALRQWRKAQSAADGVPPYAVFSNEQLADMARQRCATRADLGRIDGIGTARLQRYGDAALALIAQHTPPPAAAPAPPAA